MAGAHSESHYIKVWAILVGLLVVSVLGPMLGHPLVTLITAFGIAIVKAYLVAKNFMHLNVEKRFVGYILLSMVVLMFLMVGGVAPDVLKHDGLRWENTAAKKRVHDGLEIKAQHDAEKPHH
jgi:caa(3)-type oxidase subunit IV